MSIWTNYGMYHGNYPQEPHKPVEPVRSSYVGDGATNKGNIYYDIETNGDSEYDLDEHFADQDEERPAIPAKRYWQNLTLQDIVDLAPPGTKLTDIVFDLSFPRYMEYTEVSFKHVERNLKAEEKAYQRDYKQYQRELADYNEKYAEYLKDKEAYEKWVNEQEIKRLEEKLAKLKK